jgi:hypothetical protein
MSPVIFGQKVWPFWLAAGNSLPVAQQQVGGREEFRQVLSFCKFQEYDRLSTEHSFSRMRLPHSSIWSELSSLTKSFYT